MSESRRSRAANGRSSIALEKDGRWHGYVSMGLDQHGHAVRRHVSAKNRADVTRKVRALEGERDSGATTTPGRPPTLTSYLNQWIENRAALDVRPSTANGYRTDATYVSMTIGDVRLDRLRPAHFESLWAEMVSAGVLGSVQHVRRTLNACLADAVAQGLVARNPLRGARTPKYDEPEIEPFTVEEVRRLLTAASGERNAPRWTIAAVIGLRQGEVLGLQWGDVDVVEGTLTVRRQLQRATWKHGCLDPSRCSKRGTDCPARHGGGLTTSEPKSRAGRRTIALPASLVAELAVHRNRQVAERLAAPYWEEGTWVFTTEWGAPIDQRRDWAAFKELLDAAGLRSARLHDLRHSAATLMLESETDLQTAGRILGHGSISQTSRYTHVLADRKKAAAARIEALVWGTGTP